MKKFCAALLMAAAAATASGQGVDVYDGIWTGSWTCGPLAAGLKGGDQDGFTTKISFIVRNGSGTARHEGKLTYNDFKLNISGNQVTIEAYGAFKANSANPWVTRTSGNVQGGQIRTHGKNVLADGRVARDSCDIDLQNADVQARLDAAASAKRAAATVAQAATPQPKSEPKAPKAVVTPPPAPVPATNEVPARSAAIASLEPKAAAGKGYTKATGNPVDNVKRTGPNDVWINFNPSVTVQERQFCRVVENHRANLAAAEQTNNQIKTNEALKSFVQSLNALLPDGKIQGWVMRVVSVTQASDGSAAVLLELPCGVYVGSNTCDANPKNFYATVPESSRVYSELAKMSVKDFSLVSGQFVFPDDKAFDKNRSVAAYGYLKTAAHCQAKSMPLNSEFFGLTVTSVSVIK